MEQLELENGYYVDGPDLDNDLIIELEGFCILFTKSDVEKMLSKFTEKEKS